MKADKLIQLLFDYRPTVDTDVKIQILNNDGSVQLLDVVDLRSEIGSNGPTSIFIVTKESLGRNMSKLQQVKWLKDETGADLKTCLDAVNYAGGDLIRAKDYITYGW